MYLHTLYRYILSALRMSITANFNIDFMELDFRGEYRESYTRRQGDILICNAQVTICLTDHLENLIF